MLAWFKDPAVLPSSRGSATSPWARAGAAWPAMLKVLPICCKCAFVFEQMTQCACMIYRCALLLNIVIMLPGRGTNFRSWKKSTHHKVLKYSKASSLSCCKFGSFTVGGLPWHTTEDLNVCLTITDKLVPLVQIPFLPTSGGRTCFRNFPALRWWKLTPDLFSGEDYSLWRGNRSWIPHSHMAVFLQELEIGVVGLTWSLGFHSKS